MAPTIIRRLYWDEKLPDWYHDYWPSPNTDWIFVAVRDEAIVAYLITAPVHGTCLLLRLVSRDQTNPYTVLRLLRYAMSSIRAYGIRYVWTFVSKAGTDQTILEFIKSFKEIYLREDGDTVVVRGSVDMIR